MVISGILLQTEEAMAEEAAVLVKKVKGVEVHHIENGNKIIITLELPTLDDSYRTGEHLKQLEFIQGVYPVYINFEDEHYQVPTNG